MNISILVSGECRKNTESLIKKINKSNLFNEKIISTWNIDKIDKKLLIDWKIVVCQDPGVINKFSDKAHNILRAATLNYEGSKKITSRIAIKIRSDIFYTKFFINNLNNRLEEVSNLSRIYIDTVGTTTEWMHFSDFVLLSKSDFLKKYFENIYNSLINESNCNALEDYCKYNNIIFRKKKYNEIIPAESVNFVFGIFGHNFSDVINNKIFYEKFISSIRYFKIKDFNRGVRLDPMLSISAAYRFLRGKLNRNCVVDNLLDELYK